jgi:hypothetical protein
VARRKPEQGHRVGEPAPGGIQRLSINGNVPCSTAQPACSTAGPRKTRGIDEEQVKERHAKIAG